MKYFKSHSEFLNEAKLSAIHKAAKKGSYPVTVVVVSNGSVTKQEIVNTPAAVPAVFNELQKEYPGATINIESKTGETLFVESTITEAKFTKRSLMKAMKKDDGMIQLGNGQEYVIYNPNNGNDDNADMWQDKVIFGLDQDGEEHEIEYSDIVRYDESRKINLKQDHLSSEEYQKAKTLKDFNKEDWKWNSKSGLYDKVNESVITENRDAKTIVKAFMKAYNKGEEVDAEAWEQFMYDWAVMRNGNDELEDEVSYDTMDDVLDMLLKKGYKNIDDEAIIKLYEATDLNDPVLVAYRATRKTLPKFKPAKAKSRRLSFDKYMDLLDARLDVDQQIKDLRDEMSQTLRDMEQEAEPEGGEIADEYGSTMMDQEKEYAKLMAKKDKIMARIDKHRMA